MAKHDLILRQTNDLALIRGRELPDIVARAGDGARFAYAEFFDAAIENEHTHAAYRRAVDRFLGWCDHQGLDLAQIPPGVVGNYIRNLQTEPREHRLKNGTMEQVPPRPASKSMKKQVLAGLRKFFDVCVQRHAIVLNPASSVRGPRHSVQTGKTPAISPKQARQLLCSIDTTTVVGLRDRAIIGMLIYTAVRAGAVAKLKLKHYYSDGRQMMLHFDEKGGKERQIPCRHDLQEFIDEYMEVAGIAHDDQTAPLFRTVKGRTKQLTDNPMTGVYINRMVKRRFREASLPADRLTCHTFRATTITDLLEQGVSLEDVQQLAGHADPRTTRLYDRRDRKITRNIVERISI